MSLNDHASKQDQDFWRKAEGLGCRDHAKCHKAGLEACKDKPQHQKRNAYFKAYNTVILEAMRAKGISTQKEVRDIPAEPPKQAVKPKKQQQKAITRKNDAVAATSFYEDISNDISK